MTQSRPQGEKGNQVIPGEERRRSQRVIVRTAVTLHLTIAKQVVIVKAETVEVNDHGAMLLCTRSFSADERMEIQNDCTRQCAACRVTRVPRESAGGYLIPIEFEAPAPNFWHISFPPTDWKSRER